MARAAPVIIDLSYNQLPHCVPSHSLCPPTGTFTVRKTTTRGQIQWRKIAGMENGILVSGSGFKSVYELLHLNQWAC